jgi:hypothetical protein
VAGFNILRNLQGAYFSTTYYASGDGDLVAGTDRYRAFVLLPEFAHQLGVPNFKPDSGNLQIERTNNKMIFDNCSKTLANFGNGKG